MRRRRAIEVGEEIGEDEDGEEAHVMLDDNCLVGFAGVTSLGAMLIEYRLCEGGRMEEMMAMGKHQKPDLSTVRGFVFPSSSNRP